MEFWKEVEEEDGTISLQKILPYDDAEWSYGFARPRWQSKVVVGDLCISAVFLAMAWSPSQLYEIMIFTEADDIYKGRFFEWQSKHGSRAEALHVQEQIRIQLADGVHPDALQWDRFAPFDPGESKSKSVAFLTIELEETHDEKEEG